MKSHILTFCFFLSLSLSAQNTPVEIECNPVWQQNILSVCIGDGGMYLGDYNANGRDELILCDYRVWNILEYVPATQSYQVIWGSKEYGSLNQLFVADADNDGIQEICILHTDSYIELYDLYTHEHKADYHLDFNTGSGNTHITPGDVDNDGLIELVAMHGDYVHIFRIVNGACEKTLQIYHTATDARIGNVSGDSLNELVFNSGRVYRIVNGQPQFIWEFLSFSWYFGLVELADIDSDNILEIISVYDGFRVFDADLQSLKWQIPSVWADALTVDNIDNTGLPEIIYVEDQWGDAVCVQSTNGSELWRVDHPDHGATNVRVGDTDGDGNKEFMFGTNCSSSGPDHLIFYQLPDLNMEYITVHDQGDHRTIRVADVDADGSNELITLSRGSETNGTGIISVYNSETKQLEWKSDDSLTWLQNFVMCAMQIEDVDNDSDLEYVIASGHGYDPAISVINARTHQVDTIHVWEVNGGDQQFYALAIADLNSDGIVEYIASNEDSLFIINSQTFEKIRTFSDNTVYDFTTPVAGNIDSDPNTELVYVKYNVFVFDGLTEETWVLDTGERFMCCLLFDYNSDSVTDIIASTYNGNIYIIDGITHQATVIGNTGLPVTDLQLADIAGNSEPEFIYTYNEVLYIMNSPGDVYATTIIDDALFDANCEITDYNNDNIKEIFLGCGYYVQQLDAGCYACINLDATTQTTSTLCNASTGTASAFPTGGTEPYTFLWSTGATTSTATNLQAGVYHVTITDSIGCILNLEAEVPEMVFQIDSVTLTPDNISTEECEGTVTFHTSGGTPPYSCYYDGFWFPLTGSTLSGLCYGNYVFDLRDANYCLTDVVIYILTKVTDAASPAFSIFPNPSTGIFQLQTSLKPGSDAYAEITTIQGLPLKRILVTTQSTTIDLSQFAKGIYLITLISNEGKSTARLMVY